MKKEGILGVVSVFLALVLIVLFALNYNSNNIIVDKNHYYCASPIEAESITVDIQHKTITNENTTTYNEPYCSEIEWTLNNFILEFPLLRKTVFYGIPLLSLILFLISFIVLFTGEGWPRTVSKTILIISLFFGFLSFLIIVMWAGISAIPLVMLLVWLIALFTMGSLIINFDKNKTKRSIITIALGVIIYGINVFLTYLMVVLPYSVS